MFVQLRLEVPYQDMMDTPGVYGKFQWPLDHSGWEGHGKKHYVQIADDRGHIVLRLTDLEIPIEPVDPLSGLVDKIVKAMQNPVSELFETTS